VATSELARWFVPLSELSPYLIDGGHCLARMTDTGVVDETVVSSSFDDHAASEPGVDLPGEHVERKGQDRRS
jgi:hypothetical protein